VGLSELWAGPCRRSGTDRHGQRPDAPLGVSPPEMLHGIDSGPTRGEHFDTKMSWPEGIRAMWRSVALGLLCLTLSTPGARAKDIKFTFATTNGLQDLSSRSVLLWKEQLEKKSGNSIKMEFSPDSVLGGDQQLLQQLATNEIQMHIAGPVIVHQLAKEYQCLEAEYVFKDEAHGLKVWNGSLGKEVSDFLKKKYGIEIVAVAPRGARHVTANKPIREPSDLKGVKFRVTNNLRGQVFSAFGALPGPLSMSELYGALRQGVFDAQENPISTIYGSRLYEVQSHISLTSHVWSYNVVSANSQFLQSLSGEQRAIFDATLKDAMGWLKNAVATETDDLAAKMKKERNVETVTANVAAFREIALPIVEAFAAKSCRPGLLEEIRKAAD
jgi:tripartite ATP-independent transporter DctP family solute receptor